MPMQSAKPLQQDICRARICHEKIGINIERLLCGLGCNRYDASTTSL
jgi:hypothetical protein